MLKKLDFESRLKVDELVDRYSIKYGAGIPVNLEGLKICLEEMTHKSIRAEQVNEKFLGHLMPNPEGFIISTGIQSDFSRRLSYCHELVHILLWGWPPFLVGIINLPTLRAKEERLCDFIGVHLLCPAKAIEDFVKNFYQLPYQLNLFRNKWSAATRFKEAADRFEVPVVPFRRYVTAVYEEIVNTFMK